MTRSLQLSRSPWNHNNHYHRVVLAALPDGCERALDVGCGEGVLARELRRAVPRVTAIDRHAASLELARRRSEDTEIDYVLDDFLTHPFERASFDLVASVAALHHMDMAAALARMRQLLRPGGVLAVVGLARLRYPVDLPFAVTGALTAQLLGLRRGRPSHESPAPLVWPPAMTFGETRRLARRILPGVRYRRHLLWRYSIVWTKPAE